jgi:cephalosporin-C deacetylase-like acetyl esterase
MVPDNSDALYRCGEKVKIKITALKNGMPLNGAKVVYEVSEDLMPVHYSGEIVLKGNEGTIEAGSMKVPGYLRIKAKVTDDGKSWTYYSTVGFDHEKLMPTVHLPDDFEQFWASNLEKLAKVELNPMMELLPERCTPKVDVYHISYGNINNTRFYGILTVPKAEGKYPAILRFPGAGVHAIGGNVKDAEKGAIILELGIHGIPVNLEGSIYNDLTYGALSGYYTNNINNKDQYYYKRVYMGCVKGIDFLLSLPQCNGKVGTLGGSQGGALSIITSALDSRIAASVVYCPAFSDWEGYLHGRTGGFPHFFRAESNRTAENLETIRYYDAANFARKLKAPVYFAYGYNDLTCGPTTSRATYNAITAPKQLIVAENGGHWLYPEDSETLWDWLIEELE